MLYELMSEDRLRGIIQEDVHRLSFAGYHLTQCLSAKIKYLLSLLGEEKQITHVLSNAYIDYVEPKGTPSMPPFGGYNPWAEENLDGLQEVNMFWRNGYVRGDGVYVSGHWVRGHARYR
ncbi:hypothetical protein [Vibrio campbellii]|uniref:Uncharacterized protein n=1 Tax=Vibrio campbellii TaxID=680 RepID=A0ACC7RAV3_9VIBR